MLKYLFILCLLLFFINLTNCSIGERSQFFQNCVNNCREKNCTEGKIQKIIYFYWFDKKITKIYYLFKMVGALQIVRSKLLWIKYYFGLVMMNANMIACGEQQIHF